VIFILKNFNNYSTNVVSIEISLISGKWIWASTICVKLQWYWFASW